MENHTVGQSDQTLTSRPERRLEEANARAARFVIADVIADGAVSGVSTHLSERPKGQRLYDILRE